MTAHGDTKDILGRTYEYCLGQFAAQEGKLAGEFYTPACVVRTLVEVIKPFGDVRVYDPCCGSGGMFVQSAKFVENHQGNINKLSIFGQDSKTVPVALWFINKKKAQSGKSLFIDARNMGTMVTRRLREMADTDIAKIADTFDKFANGKFKAEKGFSAVVKTAEYGKYRERTKEELSKAERDFLESIGRVGKMVEEKG
jgi:type I restriction-modification system DNA methylase subunit